MQVPNGSGHANQDSTQHEDDGARYHWPVVGQERHIEGQEQNIAEHEQNYFFFPNYIKFFFMYKDIVQRS